MTPFARVMLVDDNDADNVYHELMLRRAGFAGEIRVFDEPQRALDELLQHPAAQPTLLLLDINMPRMDGFTFARRLGPAKTGPAPLTVVMLSSSTHEEDRQMVRSIPAVDGFVTKPLGADAAARLLRGEFEEAPPRR